MSRLQSHIADSGGVGVSALQGIKWIFLKAFTQRQCGQGAEEVCVGAVLSMPERNGTSGLGSETVCRLYFVHYHKIM